MLDIHNLKITIKGILDSQKLSVLSTQGDERPYGSLVAFAATADLKTLVFATTRATRKYSNLITHKDIAIVIDTRTNQTADFSDASAITAIGEATEVTAHERQKCLNIYIEKHPYLKEFVESPTCALIKVRVKSYILVSRFQNVQELRIS